MNNATNTETEMMTTYTDAYIEHGCAYFVALSADDAWQRELDFQNIDRYALEAKDEAGSGSALRGLYEAKVQADEELRKAADTLRTSGTTAEIQAVSELYSD